MRTGERIKGGVSKEKKWRGGIIHKQKQTRLGRSRKTIGGGRTRVTGSRTPCGPIRAADWRPQSSPDFVIN